jgi:hypothetical protein
MNNTYRRIHFGFLFLIPFILINLHECNAQSLANTSVDTVRVMTYKIKGKTATGKRTYKIKDPFLAVSRDLLSKYPLKSTIELLDCRWAGKYKVLDILGKNHVSTVDIFYKGKKKSIVKCLCKPSL